MSRRPTDWSPLAGSDPVHGDPEQVERAAKSLTDVAEEITRQAANLRKLSTAEGWDADAGRTFADSARDLAGQLDKARGRYATAGGALTRYAPELRHAQSLADGALAEAKQAQSTINANRPPAQPPAGPPTPDEATAQRRRQYDHDEGISALQAAQRKLTEATDHRDEHARRAARAISESIDNDGLKDSWWDKFKNWVHEHADILKAIAKIAEMVATVLSTIALLISWIPVLDFLSPVLLGLAALASGVALVCNLMLAMAGEGSWLNVAADLFAVVTFGYGAKAGLALRAGEAAEGETTGVAETVGRDIRGTNPGRAESRSLEDTPCKSDPVDVATGRVVLTQTDVELAGILPLVLSRAHISSYRVGRWFGPSWASTLDQRLEIEDTGVYYAAEDGMLLVYPVPTEGHIPADGLSVLPEEGPRWPLSRTDDGGYTITDPQRGHTLHFALDGAVRGKALPLSAVTDRVGHRIDFDYAGDGTLTEIRHSGGYRIGVDTAGGRISALRLRGADADVVLVRYGYDGSGRLTEVTNSSGTPLRFDYDADGRLTGWRDRNDVAYRYTYDEAGRCVRTTGSDGFMSGTFAYDPDARVTVFTDSLGHAATCHLNELGQLVREVDPLGQSTVSVWDRYDRLLSRTDPLGRATRYTYDGAGNLVALTRPDGSRVHVEYNELALPVTVTEPDGATWRRSYDERGNLTTVTDPLEATTSYTYDEWGHLSAVTDALGYIRRAQIDAAGLPTAVTDPLGATTHYARDGFGRVSAITDPVGGVTRFGWTIEGKPAWRTLPDGATERWSYDGEGNLVEHLDALGQLTRTEFTHFDLPAARIGPDGARLEFGYDTELRLVSVTNPQGLAWRYDYDPAGNLVRETDFNRRELSYAHDAAGQLTKRTNGAGQSTHFVRDPLGNVVEQRSEGVVATFGYDALGRLMRATNADAEVTFDRDALGRVLTETCNGRAVTFSYDPLGRRTHRRTPSGAQSGWEYGAGAAPVALHTAGRTLRFGYDAAGREVERHLGAGAMLAQSWDTNHRLTTQTLTAGGPTSAREARLVQRRSYRYRPDGYVTTIEDHLSGLRRFDLDPAGRVTAVDGAGWTERYAYDPAGNITAAAWPTPQTDTPDADARGEREYSGTLIRRAGTIRYQHDAQGRVTLRQQKRLSAKPRTWHYSWNADDRLTGVTTPDGAHWRYRYDPLGRRISKQRLGSEGVSVAEQVDFTWDGTTLAEQTHTTGPDGPARTTSWDWEPDTFRPLTQTERAPLRDAPQEWVDEQFYAIVTDLVGTPTEMLNPDGTLVWHPRTTLWGTAAAPISDGVSCPLRFPGQYHDPETGLNYNYHRYYDPAGGRYGSSDPLGLNGGHNPHTYVPNPTNWLDPLGLTPCLDQLAANANKTHEGDLTAAGRALQKKLGRPGEAPKWSDHVPAKGSPEGYSAAGREFVEELLTNPKTSVGTETGRNLTGKWDTLLSYRLPSGIGARFEQGGDFVGFVT
ncbi:MAG: RHS repeat-associated core domain-containing protein [Pseudonocardiaceae bacterium]